MGDTFQAGKSPAGRGVRLSSSQQVEIAEERAASVLKVDLINKLQEN